MVHLLRTSYAFGQPLLQALAASRLVNSAELCRDVRIAESLQTCLNTVICIVRPIGRDGQLTLRFASAFLRAAARRTPSPMALRHSLLRFVRSVLTVSPSVFRLRYGGLITEDSVRHITNRYLLIFAEVRPATLSEAP